MAKYEVHEKTWGEFSVPLFGRLSFEFEAGVHDPKNEQEESCLKVLVARGAAHVVTAKKKETHAS